MSLVGSCKLKVNTIMKGKGPMEWYSFTLLKETERKERRGGREEGLPGTFPIHIGKDAVKHRSSKGRYNT